MWVVLYAFFHQKSLVLLLFIVLLVCSLSKILLKELFLANFFSYSKVKGSALMSVINFIGVFMKLNKATLIATAAAALSLTAISAQASIIENSSKGELSKIIYSCEGKKTLDVIFINTDKNSFAIINQVDEMIPLEIENTASGANYKAINKNYTYELKTKGNTASLFGDGKAILKNCVTE